MWVYGVAGLVGFLAQIVAGIEGRLVPLYAWYRAFAKRARRPTARKLAALAAFARRSSRAGPPAFLCWPGALRHRSSPLIWLRRRCCCSAGVAWVRLYQVQHAA